MESVKNILKHGFIFLCIVGWLWIIKGNIFLQALGILILYYVVEDILDDIEKKYMKITSIDFVSLRLTVGSLEDEIEELKEELKRNLKK